MLDERRSRDQSREKTRDGIRDEIRRAIEEYCRGSLADAFDPRSPRVRLHEPTFGAAEIWEAVDSLLTTRVTAGEKVRRFEREFATRLGSHGTVSRGVVSHDTIPHATMVNSGSSANLLAIAALTNPQASQRLDPGDEVIVPALCWSTSVWPIVQCGLVPVIVDIDPRTWNVDADEIERAIGPRTRGLLVVHVYGNPCDLRELREITDRYELTLVEDCCEALGATFDGRPVGTTGRAASFSFYFSHHMTTLEGGMSVTADAELAELFRILRAHGWIRDVDDRERYTARYPEIDPRFLFVNVGYNLRPTELQGGVGLAQIDRLSEFVAIRRDNARYWEGELAALGEFFELQRETPGGASSWFGFPVVVSDQAPFGVASLRRFLEEKGIETRPIIAGNIARQPALTRIEHRVVGDLRHADRIMKNAFAIGNHQAVDSAARSYVVDTLREFLRLEGLV